MNTDVLAWSMERVGVDCLLNVIEGVRCRQADLWVRIGQQVPDERRRRNAFCAIPTRKSLKGSVTVGGVRRTQSIGEDRDELRPIRLPDNERGDRKTAGIWIRVVHALSEEGKACRAGTEGRVIGQSPQNFETQSLIRRGKGVGEGRQTFRTNVGERHCGVASRLRHIGVAEKSREARHRSHRLGSEDFKADQGKFLPSLPRAVGVHPVGKGAERFRPMAQPVGDAHLPEGRLVTEPLDQSGNVVGGEVVSYLLPVRGVALPVVFKAVADEQGNEYQQQASPDEEGQALPHTGSEVQYRTSRNSETTQG